MRGVGLKCTFLLGRDDGEAVDEGEDRERKELSLLVNPLTWDGKDCLQPRLILQTQRGNAGRQREDMTQGFISAV